MSSSALHVARGASYLFIQSTASNLISVVVFALIARPLGQSGLGMLAALSLLVAFIQVISNLGTANAVTKYVAENLAKGERKAASGAFYQSLRVSAATSIIPSAICFILAEPLSQTLLRDAAYTQVFRLLPIHLILSAGVIQNQNSCLLGLQKFRQLASITILTQILRQGLMILLIYRGYGVYGIVVAWTIGSTASAAIFSIPITKELGPPTFAFDLHRLLRFSVPLLFGGFASFTQTWFDTAILLAYVSMSEVGIYNAAITAFGALNTIPTAISTALFPHYAQLQGKRRNIEDAIPQATRYTLFITLPLALGLLATARPALSIFVGQTFEEGATTLAILCLSLAFTCIGAALTSILLVLEKTTLQTAITVAAVAASTLTALLLLPTYGIAGASTARGISMAITLALTITALKGEIKLKLDLQALKKSTTASTIMAITVIVAETLHYDRTLLPAYILLGAATYTLALRILRAAKKEDIDLIRGYLGQRLSLIPDLATKLLNVD